jgi:hypothetical protein
MSKLSFNRVAATIFAVVAIVHAYRLVSFFPVQLGSVQVPGWASWLALVIAGLLSMWGFRARD